MDRERLEEEDYWRERWQNNETSWQLSAPHSSLVENIETLAPAPARQLDHKPRTIFVPLTGKTLDVHYLSDIGYNVIGCELSDIAVRALFAEMQVTPTIRTEVVGGKSLTVYEHGLVKIYNANFFDLGNLGEVSGVYDRAALVALPGPTRLEYTRHMIAITNNAPQLVIAFEHGRQTVPPHSVPLDLIEQYYGAVYTIITLSRRIAMNGIIEAVYLLTSK